MNISVTSGTVAALCFGLGIFWTCASQAKLPQVEHIVIIFQENRTPDNLFHGLKHYLPSADIADSGVNSKGQTVALTPIPLAGTYDIGHTHGDFLAMYDGGKMNGADRELCVPYIGTVCTANAPFHYIRYADVAPYFDIARNYGFANRMFQTNQGPSFPAHQFIFAGTSQVYADIPLFASENPSRGPAAGCVAPSDQLVYLIDPTGKENYRAYPCFEHQTLADLLDRPPGDPTHPLSWRYYGAPGEGSIWMAPNAIQHICGATGSPLSCGGPHWTSGDVSLWPAQVLLDIKQKKLATVSWVTPSGLDSDHAGSNDGSGPSWVASVVNAIGQSPYWKNTVIFITWDDWGGWYDHVAPPIDATFGFYEYGFRVPLLVVSPYTTAGYVSQSRHDFGSILRFVETAFNLGRIPPGNFADARADDLSDFFDFTKSPRPFVPIPLKVPASKFLDRTRAVTAPDND